MEDIRLGRKSPTASKQVAFLAGVTKELVPANESRVTLTVGGSGNTVCICPDENNPSAGDGFAVNPSVMPLTFTVQVHGDIVTKRWVGAGQTLGATLQVIETYQPER
jgi:hypothetical protein